MAYLHLFGIGRDAVDYVMETFPIVKRKGEATHAECLTRQVILEMYGEMRQAMRGEPYKTRLDPPPEYPRAAHPERD